MIIFKNIFKTKNPSFILINLDCENELNSQLNIKNSNIFSLLNKNYNLYSKSCTTKINNKIILVNKNNIINDNNLIYLSNQKINYSKFKINLYLSSEYSSHCSIIIEIITEINGNRTTYNSITLNVKSFTIFRELFREQSNVNKKINDYEEHFEFNKKQLKLAFNKTEFLLYDEKSINDLSNFINGELSILDIYNKIIQQLL